MKFFDPLVIRWTGSNQWILEKELRCESADGTVIYIPAGAATDLASIPKILHPILSPAGLWARASVMHDRCYKERLFRRQKCDSLFLEAMLSDRVPTSTARLIYRAVRTFGQGAYDAHK